ncbi:MAG: Panacea domain-containing protein [Pseudonocardiaceae bacterium]
MPPPVSAHDIATELRAQRPGMLIKKLHKLLYYCQGHHLAWFGQPLFVEAIEAWDMGPVVAELWRDENRGNPTPPCRELGNQELNTVGYVLSRYGKLSGRDLEHLSHSEDPWRDANEHRRPRGAVLIEHDALVTYFTADHEENAIPRSVIAEIKRRMADQPPLPPPSGRDGGEALRAFRDAALNEITAR